MTETLPEPEPVEEPEPENPDAEPDEPDDEPDDEPTEPTEPTEPSTETVLAERHKALASETRRHETRLRTIYGDDFDSLAPCPLCLTDGWVVPAPPGAMPDEQWEAIQHAAGQVVEAEYAVADYAETCPTCNGWGQVLSGSKTEAQRLIPCRPCEGKGWKAKLDAPAAVPTFTLPGPPPANGAATLDWTRPRDAYGRPEGHPHFGMEPSLVGLG